MVSNVCLEGGKYADEGICETLCESSLRLKYGTRQYSFDILQIASSECVIGRYFIKLCHRIVSFSIAKWLCYVQMRTYSSFRGCISSIAMFKGWCLQWLAIRCPLIRVSSAVRIVCKIQWICKFLEIRNGSVAKLCDNYEHVQQSKPSDDTLPWRHYACTVACPQALPRLHFWQRPALSTTAQCSKSGPAYHDLHRFQSSNNHHKYFPYPHTDTFHGPVSCKLEQNWPPIPCIYNCRSRVHILLPWTQGRSLTYPIRYR